MLVGVWIGALSTTNTLGIDLNVLALLGIVVTIHAFDDHSGLSARQRLAVDAMIALTFTIVTGAAIGQLGMAFGVPLLLGSLAIPVTVIAYLALSNAFNMLDGVDGVAISQFLISAFAIGVWNVAYAPNHRIDGLIIAVVAAALPIFVANLGLLGAQLKCFLGDSGARFLGFFLTYTLIVESGRAFSPIDGAYLVAVPLLDMCAVVIERLKAGAGPMRPDRRHLHHLLADSVGSHKLAAGVMALISMAFIALFWALQALEVGDPQSAALFLGLAALYMRYRRKFVAVLVGLAERRNANRITGPAE